MRFQFIDDHRPEFPVKLMYRVLDISRSGYYAWRERPPSARKMADQQLLEQINETISTHVLSLDDFNICCEFKLLFPLWLWHKRFVRKFSRHTI
jgi:hypothetical protein